MRYRFHVDADRDKEIRVHPRDFVRLIDEAIRTGGDFTVTRQTKTISGCACVLIIGKDLFILDANAKELGA